MLSLEQAAQLIRCTPDYPKPGVLFRDITPLVANGPALQAVTCAIVANAPEFDVVAGIEARGFLLAGAVAAHTGKGALAIRKAGKLAQPVASASYELEYGSATVEVQQDIAPQTRVLVVDDALATGGTAVAAHKVLQAIRANVVGFAFLLEIPGLGGAQKLADFPVQIVFDSV